MRLIPSPPGRITAGRVWLGGRDLLSLTEKEMVKTRGREISMVFQEPMTSLNPVFTVGEQVAEVFRTHLGLKKRESRERAVQILEKVGIPDPAHRARDYPHQMSGGMRQRVLIAIALACNPEVLIADEPTTALDVTVQAQILFLIAQLRDDTGAGVFLITHDFGVVAEAVDDVAVMYAGLVVEQADCKRLFASPWHPYTSALLHSRPSLGLRSSEGGRHLEVIPGTVPDLSRLPPGCAFEPRCRRRQPLCRERPPLLEEKEPGQWVRCWIPP